MKFEIVGARNFRTLENFEVSLKQSYCAISGKNNAGKTALVRILRHFFDQNRDDVYFDPETNSISFSRDFTQWSKDDFLEVWVSVKLHRVDDSELFFVVQAFSELKDFEGDTFDVFIKERFEKSGASSLKCEVNGLEIEGQSGLEIIKKLRSSRNLFVYNSTQPSRRIYYRSNSLTEVLEAHFSQEDRTKIAEAERSLEGRVKKAAKQHKDELDKLLGKLADKYQVELSTLERGRSSRFPLEIKLNDQNVEVPLIDWGAGTQNRTRVLIAVLEAVRVRETVSAENRSTPVFLVEEPESFLHPSAQAEFGQVLNGLANELSIQIIATTHSPYMLNQSEPAANLLLERRSFRKALRETYLKETSGDKWMMPFAENLGVIPKDFDAWSAVFQANSGRVIFVEGDIDKQYFSHISETYPEIYCLSPDIEVIPYDGVGALKNTSILKFMVSKFSRVYVTYDLDCEAEVKPSLERIGLLQNKDFCSVGRSEAGCDNIEGLLPSKVKQAVYSSRHDLVSALGSSDSKAKNSAKNELKKELLNEFKKTKIIGERATGIQEAFHEY